MTRKISLVATSVLAGLALVPAAWGNHQYGDAFIHAQQPDFWNYDQQAGAKITDTSPNVLPQDVAALYATQRRDDMLIARERALDARLEAAKTATPIDVVERATSTGSAFDWLQIGIGFGVGIVLAFGLFLGLRLMRIRPPAY